MTAAEINIYQTVHHTDTNPAHVMFSNLEMGNSFQNNTLHSELLEGNKKCIQAGGSCEN